jgi:hypothetical protein
MSNPTKMKLLKTTLYIGVAYYLIGAIVHYFGLTLFPWFDGRLYTPYQDSVIAFVAVVLAYFLFIVARNPVKNIDWVVALFTLQSQLFLVFGKDLFTL